MSSSITKLIGESFKIHAQALVGYEEADPSNAEADASQAIGARPADALEMQAAY